MNKKIRVLLLASLVLVGCNTATVQENEAQVESGEQVEATGEATGDAANKDETANSSNDDIVKISDDSFVQQLEDIHANVDEYEGKTVSYEGFVAVVGEDGTEYTVVRDYDTPHEDHTHPIFVGLYSSYEGEWPAEDTWVEVTGKIKKESMNGQTYPLVEIEELKVMDVRGEDKVYG